MINGKLFPLARAATGVCDMEASVEQLYARLDHSTKRQVFQEMGEWCDSLERARTLVKHPKYPLIMQWYPESAYFFSGVARRSLAHAKILFTSIPKTVKPFIFDEIFSGVSEEGMPFAKLCFAHPLAGSLSPSCLKEYADLGFDQYKLVVHAKKVNLTWSEWSFLLRKSQAYFTEFIKARASELDSTALLELAKSHCYQVFDFIIPRVVKLLSSHLKQEKMLSWKGVLEILKVKGPAFHPLLVAVDKESFELNREECLRRIYIALKGMLPVTHWAQSSINPSQTSLRSLSKDVLNMIAERGNFGDLVQLGSTCKVLRKNLAGHVGVLKTFIQALPGPDPRKLIKPCLLSVNCTRAALRANVEFYPGQLVRLVKASILHASVVLPSNQVKKIEDREAFLNFFIEKGYAPLVAKYNWYAFSGYRLMQIAQRSVVCAQAVLNNPKAKARLKEGHLKGIVCASPAHVQAFAKEFLPKLKRGLLEQLIARQREVIFALIEETLAKIYASERITNFHLFRAFILRKTKEGDLARLFLEWVGSLSTQFRSNWIKWVASKVRRDRKVSGLQNGGGGGSSVLQVDRRR